MPPGFIILCLTICQKKSSSVAAGSVRLWTASCLVRLSERPPQAAARSRPQKSRWRHAEARQQLLLPRPFLVVVVVAIILATCRALGIFYKKNLTRFMQQQLQQWPCKLAHIALHFREITASHNAPNPPPPPPLHHHHHLHAHFITLAAFELLTCSLTCCSLQSLTFRIVSVVSVFFFYHFCHFSLSLSLILALSLNCFFFHPSFRLLIKINIS